MDDIRRAAQLIRAGQLVAFPTETVYGLGANALDAEAVRRIYQVKGRPLTSPLIVHVSSPEMARGLAASWPGAAQRLTARWWPGPLTVVVRKQPVIPDLVTAGLPTVGLRMPSHPLALDLIREAGVPIAAPSANRFSEVSPTTAEHVRASLGSHAALILDGGPCTVGIESTVISVTGERPVLLRPGIIPLAELEPWDEFIRQGPSDPSPGLAIRHYSPRTPLRLGLPPVTGRGAYLYWNQPAPAAELRRMPQQPAGYAAALYDVLHQLDTQGWDWIAVEPVPAGGEWAGIRDRLERAAASG